MFGYGRNRYGKKLLSTALWCLIVGGLSTTAQAADVVGYVWFDLDGNGIQDAGETGRGGIDVRLTDVGLGVQIGAVVTNGAGIYQFLALPAGNYLVEFGISSGQQLSPQDEGADDTVDSDADPTTGRTATQLLGPNDSAVLDAGIILLGGIVGLFWSDIDGDGIQDVNEPGLPGLEVVLYDDASQTELAATLTDTTGYYVFAEYPPGAYFVEFRPPVGERFSPRDQGGDDSIDSDADPANGRTVADAMVGGDVLHFDAGIVGRGGILGLFWSDVDGDGIQDASEPGLPNLEVVLYDDASQTDLATTLTDTAGVYVFPEYLPGDYFVEFRPPVGERFSPRDQGGDDSIDSDADPVSGRTVAAALVSNRLLRFDAGIVGRGGILGLFWSDVDGDGIQDASEPGLPNLEVVLYDDASQTELAATLTDTAGVYVFPDYLPGDYFVEFRPPAGEQFTLRDQGSDDSIDSDADPVSGRTVAAALVSSGLLRFDAGIAGASTLPAVVATDSHCDCLYSLDASGDRMEIGDLGAGYITPIGMAADSADTIYVINNSGAGRFLLTVNPATGEATEVCALSQVLSSLAINPVPVGPWPADTIFAANRNLYVIESDCSMTDLGPIGPTGTEPMFGLAFDSSGQLFALEGRFGVSPFYSIDNLAAWDGPEDAAGTWRGDAPLTIAGALDFDGAGLLWASDIYGLSRRLVSLDPASGAIGTEVWLDDFQVGLPMAPQGLAFLLEPGQGFLELGSGLRRMTREGRLPAKVGESLQAKLSRALEQYSSGRMKSAIAQLRAFEKQLTGVASRVIIESQDLADLLVMVERTIEAIDGSR